MDGPEDACHGCIGAWNADDVDVVRHEAISPDFEAMSRSKVGEQLQILAVIFCFGEHGLPVVAPLGDMVRVTYRYGTRYSRHGSNLR